MAINTFAEKVTKYLGILDELYIKGAITAILDSPAMAARFVGTNKIKLPKVSVDGAGNYDRDDGYAQGGVAVTYEEHELKYDRGRKFRIDVIDNDETAFDLYREVANQYVKTKEVPEVDAIRFSEIYDAATREDSLGTVVEKDLADEESALGMYDEAEQVLNEKEAPEEGRIMFCSNAYYAKLKKELKDSGRIDMSTIKIGNIDRRVTMLDGVTPIIKVPSARFWSHITLLDGSTTDQKKGGYEPIAGTSKPINFIYGTMDALKGGAIKRNANKLIAPEANQSADAWDIFYRCHHDLIIPDNKTGGIYIHVGATAHTA